MIPLLQCFHQPRVFLSLMSTANQILILATFENSIRVSGQRGGKTGGGTIRIITFFCAGEVISVSASVARTQKWHIFKNV